MYKAIIVDDDPWALIDIMACFPFTTNAFDVVAKCASAEIALPYILNYKPELVVTDIRMERSSGLELIGTCRDRGINSLFVIVSGYDSFEYAKKAIELGAFYYMLKPIGDSEAQEVLQRAAQQLATRASDQSKINGGESSDTFMRILDYLVKHSGEECTLDELSKVFFLNRTYICDLFQKRTNKTFTENLTDIRMCKACNLLMNSSIPIGNVAQQVGFTDTHYFTRVFKSTIGTTPREYRNKQRPAQEYPK